MITIQMCVVLLIGGGFMLVFCKLASLRQPLPPTGNPFARHHSHAPLVRLNPRLFV